MDLEFNDFPHLLASLVHASQSRLHDVGFRLSGLALSFGEPYMTYNRDLIPLLIEKHILGLANSLAALKDPVMWAALFQHEDYLVRWLSLDLHQRCSPEDSVYWQNHFDLVEGRLRDSRAHLRDYATHILEDYRLDKAIYDLRHLDKSDPNKKTLIAKIREHRKKIPLTVESMALTFPQWRQDSSYTRSQLDAYVEQCQANVKNPKPCYRGLGFSLFTKLTLSGRCL